MNYRHNQHNQTVYRRKDYKLITSTIQLLDLVRAYKFISIVDHKTVAQHYYKARNFPALLLSDIFDIKIVNNNQTSYLVIFDKSTKTGFVLRPNFLVAEITDNNLVIICNDYMEKVDAEI